MVRLRPCGAVGLPGTARKESTVNEAEEKQSGSNRPFKRPGPSPPKQWKVMSWIRFGCCLENGREEIWVWV